MRADGLCFTTSASLLAAGHVPQTCLATQLFDDLRPALVPAVIAGQVAQRQQGIDMGAGPMHATAFEARFHHQLVAALHRAVSDGPTGGLKLGVAQVGGAFLQIS